jgi:hypothetical protein
MVVGHKDSTPLIPKSTNRHDPKADPSGFHEESNSIFILPPLTCSKSQPPKRCVFKLRRRKCPRTCVSLKTHLCQKRLYQVRT